MSAVWLLLLALAVTAMTSSCHALPVRGAESGEEAQVPPDFSMLNKTWAVVGRNPEALQAAQLGFDKCHTPEEFERLIDRSDCFSVSPLTHARAITFWRRVKDLEVTGMIQVEILEGPHKGAKGWVSNLVRRVK